MSAPMPADATQEVARRLGETHARMAEAIGAWAAGDTELGWPGDPILQDPGNCDDLAAFLQERGFDEVTR